MPIYKHFCTERLSRCEHFGDQTDNMGEVEDMRGNEEVIRDYSPSENSIMTSEPN